MSRKVKIITAMMVLVASITASFVIVRAGDSFPKPSLSCVSVESEALDDRFGEGMSLVTFCVSNTRPPELRAGRFLPEAVLFVKKANTAAQFRRSGVWVQEMEALPMPLDCVVWPGKTQEGFLIVPTGSEFCLVPLRCTLGTVGWKGRVGIWAEGLPLSFRSKLPTGFWRWVGPMNPAPSSDWKDCMVSLEMPANSANH